MMFRGVALPGADPKTAATELAPKKIGANAPVKPGRDAARSGGFGFDEQTLLLW